VVLIYYSPAVLADEKNSSKKKKTKEVSCIPKSHQCINLACILYNAFCTFFFCLLNPFSFLKLRTYKNSVDWYRGSIVMPYSCSKLQFRGSTAG